MIEDEAAAAAGGVVVYLRIYALVEHPVKGQETVAEHATQASEVFSLYP